MKRWIKRTLIGIFGASAILGGFAVWTHHHHRHGWQNWSEADAAAMKSRVVEKVGKRLDLDDLQKAKLGVLADKLREQRNAIVGSGADPRSELAAMIQGTSFDRKRASALIETKLAAVNTKSPEVVAALADFYDSLKPGQQTQVREFLARRGRHG